jgi:hypothetical protein
VQDGDSTLVPVPGDTSQVIVLGLPTNWYKILHIRYLRIMLANNLGSLINNFLGITTVAGDGSQISAQILYSQSVFT